jgi:hypothetical protein
MNAAALLSRLVSLNGIVSDPGRSPREMHEAMFQMHELVREMRQDEVENLLTSMIGHPTIDPQNGTLAAGLAEMLLERWVDSDLDVAISWARTHDSLAVITRILSRRDPMEAVRLARDLKLKLDDPFAEYNIGRFGAELGPSELLALEDVLGRSGVRRALESIPPSLCEAFAEKWHERLESESSDLEELRHILERWGELAPREMLAWYRSRPHLGSDVHFVYGLMSTLLDFHQQAGLDFAEAEFRRAPERCRWLFTIAVNSNSEPAIWRKLAERLPPDAKPTIREFAEHFRPGFAPGIEGILTAAACIGEPEQRYHYLMRVLTNSEGWANQERGWSDNAIQSARGDLEKLSLRSGQLAEVLELVGRVETAAASRKSRIPNR